ncbi:MAG: nucleotidyl transferase AbiEii/AbiGii toxin family protein [Candidatus Sulfomarinibacteraceae bacterium]
MTARLDRPATRDGLFLWVMHRFAEVFEEHAVLKGGLAMRLIDSPRMTVDIDYVFVPFTSKKQIADRVEAVLREIEGASIAVRLHSKMLRAELRVDDQAVLVEINVAEDCESIAMTTGGFARSLGQPAQVIRVMGPGSALSHKLAAWNERRLLRDLYDCYFLAGRVGVDPDLEVLNDRLAHVESRLPALRKRTSMSREQLAAELRLEIQRLDDEDLGRELSGLLPGDELAGLAIRIRPVIERVAVSITNA